MTPFLQPFLLVLLIGQSNMAGRGIVEPCDREVIPHLMMLDQNLIWKPAVDPLHQDRPRLAGVGPGRTFGKLLLEANPGATVGLIPCAVGGRPIQCWEPGRQAGGTDGFLYDDMLKRAREALKSGKIVAVLWHQGESNAGSPGSVAEYSVKLKMLHKNLYRDLNLSDDVPFIVGELGTFLNAKEYGSAPLLNQEFRNYAASNLYTGCVSSAGLTDKGDRLHFDAESARELGKRYFLEYQKLRKRIVPSMK